MGNQGDRYGTMDWRRNGQREQGIPPAGVDANHAGFVIAIDKLAALRSQRRERGDWNGVAPRGRRRCRGRHVDDVAMLGARNVVNQEQVTKGQHLNRKQDLADSPQPTQSRAR